MVDNTGAFTNDSTAALNAEVDSVFKAFGGTVGRTKVAAGDGAKIFTRDQLKDQTFFDSVKDILFTEPDLTIIDTHMSQLQIGSTFVDADSPAGMARIEELQAAWQSRILKGNQLGNAILGMLPNLDPPAAGWPLSNGQADSAVQ